MTGKEAFVKGFVEHVMSSMDVWMFARNAHRDIHGHEDRDLWQLLPVLKEQGERLYERLALQDRKDKESEYF